MSQMTDRDRDTLMRMAAFEHVRRLSEVHDHLTANELTPGFIIEGERIPLVNPQRGIFKPRQMRFLLSIKTVFLDGHAAGMILPRQLVVATWSWFGLGLGLGLIAR